MSSTATEAPRLAGGGELSSAVNQLMDIQEQVLEPIMHSVFRALNYKGEQTITFEQIGRLGAWAREAEGIFDGLRTLAKNMQEVCLNDLPPIASARVNPHQPRFDEFGYRV